MTLADGFGTEQKLFGAVVVQAVAAGGPGILRSEFAVFRGHFPAVVGPVRLRPGVLRPVCCGGGV